MTGHRGAVSRCLGVLCQAGVLQQLAQRMLAAESSVELGDDLDKPEQSYHCDRGPASWLVHTHALRSTEAGLGQGSPLRASAGRTARHVKPYLPA